MEIDLDKNSLPIIHAFDSATRIDILNLLAHKKMNITQVAKTLHYSKAIISKHIRILKQANLVFETKEPGGDHRQKILSVHSDSFLFNLPQRIYPSYLRKDFDIPLGNYFSANNITPTCGLVDENKIIGRVDDPDIFLSPQRFTTKLLWFSKGSIEYIIPNPFVNLVRPELIETSFEISSEFPASNNNWPSDISFWFNDVKVGTWTVPGNFSDVRGKLTPSWWRSDFSQYGILKHLRVSREDSSIDGVYLSYKNLSDLNLENSRTLKFKIGIDPRSSNQGGLTIFGKNFGNYNQDIHLTAYYSNPQ